MNILKNIEIYNTEKVYSAIIIVKQQKITIKISKTGKYVRSDILSFKCYINKCIVLFFVWFCHNSNFDEFDVYHFNIKFVSTIWAV